jgi:hypothetical protein
MDKKEDQKWAFVVGAKMPSHHDAIIAQFVSNLPANVAQNFSVMHYCILLKTCITVFHVY